MGKLSDLFGDIAYSIKFEVDNSKLNSINSGNSWSKKLSDPMMRDGADYPEVDRQARHDIEKRAHEINPIFGKTVGKINNIIDTVDNATDSINPIKQVFRAFWPGAGEIDISLADHLYVQRPQFTHHGLYIGSGQVIHYTGGFESGGGAIRTDSLETFANGFQIMAKGKDESPIKFSQNEAISRAYTRLGESEYNIVTNNCEHFVRWCRYGVNY